MIHKAAIVKYKATITRKRCELWDSGNYLFFIFTLSKTDFNIFSFQLSFLFSDKGSQKCLRASVMKDKSFEKLYCTIIHKKAQLEPNPRGPFFNMCYLTLDWATNHHFYVFFVSIFSRHFFQVSWQKNSMVATFQYKTLFYSQSVLLYALM